MTDLNYTHIKVVVDRSGSMASCRSDMIGGLDQFFEDQAKLPGRCLVDYSQFDDRYENVFFDKNVKDARAVLQPRGLTALVDAIGKSVTEFGEKLAALPENERPGKVIVVVVTDGFENASTEWTADKVKELVKQQQDEYSWDFVFLGANMDAVSVSAQYGFQGGSTLTYNTANPVLATASLSGYVSRTRTAGSATFTDEDRQANA